MTGNLARIHFDYYDDDAYNKAGWAERNCVENASSVHVFMDSGHKLYRFNHVDGERYATWDATFKRWI